VPSGANILPTIPFAPGKVLSVRSNQVFVVDFTQTVPVATQTDDIDQVRYYASGTVLANGKVLVTGGSTVPNQLTGVAYQVEIWDPATGHWTAGASAAEPRLYHSNALLLTDATVLTGGGGAPGPLANLNAEIYYPPYLYTSSGQPAVRPAITSVSSAAGATLSVTVGPTDQISRLTFVRTGSATHDNNLEQRFIDLAFQQSGQQLTATLPSDPTVLVPGYYMLFAFDQAGVPSIAQVLFVDPTSAGPPTVAPIPPVAPVPPLTRKLGPPSLLWRNGRTGKVVIWLMNGSNVAQSAVIGTAGSNWKILGTGDFTGQGNSDVLLSNTITRELAIWFMKGASVTGRQDFFLHGVGGMVQGIGDLVGNGFADLIFRNSSNGNTWVLLNNGPPNFNVSWSGKVPPNWVIAGLADTAGSGVPQLIWRNRDTGRIIRWFFSNGVPTQAIDLGRVPPAWALKGFGDLDGNGSDDIIWQNSNTGAVIIWYSSGAQFSASAVLGKVAPRWSLSGTAYLNGNGPGQIIWRNTANGQVLAWNVNGSSVSAALLPPHPDLTWELQPTQPVNH